MRLLFISCLLLASTLAQTEEEGVVCAGVKTSWTQTTCDSITSKWKLIAGKDGSLDSSKLSKALTILEPEGEEIQESDVSKEILSELDMDKDGKATLEEFITAASQYITDEVITHVDLQSSTPDSSEKPEANPEGEEVAVGESPSTTISHTVKVDGISVCTQFEYSGDDQCCSLFESFPSVGFVDEACEMTTSCDEGHMEIDLDFFNEFCDSVELKYFCTPLEEAEEKEDECDNDHDCTRIISYTAEADGVSVCTQMTNTGDQGCREFFQTFLSTGYSEGPCQFFGECRDQTLNAELGNKPFGQYCDSIEVNYYCDGSDQQDCNEENNDCGDENDDDEAKEDDDSGCDQDNDDCNDDDGGAETEDENDTDCDQDNGCEDDDEESGGEQNGEETETETDEDDQQDDEDCEGQNGAEVNRASKAEAAVGPGQMAPRIKHVERPRAVSPEEPEDFFQRVWSNQPQVEPIPMLDQRVYLQNERSSDEPFLSAKSSNKINQNFVLVSAGILLSIFAAILYFKKRKSRSLRVEFYDSLPGSV